MNRSRSTAIAAALLVAWFVFATLALVFLAGRASAQPPEATCRTWANPVAGNTFVFSPGDYDLVVVHLVDGTSFELRDVVFEQRIDAAVPIAGLSKCDLPEPTPTPVVPTPTPEPTPTPVAPTPTPTATPERPTPTPSPTPTATTPPAPTPRPTPTYGTPTDSLEPRPTPTATATPTSTPSATPTATPTITPGVTPTPQPDEPPALADTGPGHLDVIVGVALVLGSIGGLLLCARRYVR